MERRVCNTIHVPRRCEIRWESAFGFWPSHWQGRPSPREGRRRSRPPSPRLWRRISSAAPMLAGARNRPSHRILSIRGVSPKATSMGRRRLADVMRKQSNKAKFQPWFFAFNRLADQDLRSAGSIVGRKKQSQIGWGRRVGRVHVGLEEIRVFGNGESGYDAAPRLGMVRARGAGLGNDMEADA